MKTASSLLMPVLRCACMALGLLVCAGLPASSTTVSIAAPGRQAGELERVQMHANKVHGLHYLPNWLPSDAPEPAQFTLQPVTSIPLDGDPELNVRGTVYPIRWNSKAAFGFVHVNGYRLLRVYAADGHKVWQVDAPSGRVHRDNVHTDSLAVFDVNGDGAQDIVHCWTMPGSSAKQLVARDGRNGAVLSQVSLPGQSKSDECQIAAFRVAGADRPYLFVAGKAPAASGCASNYEDTFSQTIVFRADPTRLTKLWEQTTCAAGHYAYPLDRDGNGKADAIFVGKYLFAPDGTLLCTLPGWGTDHIDSMVVADLDDTSRGQEVFAAGYSGVRLYHARDCTLAWTIDNKTIVHPQHATATRLQASGVLDLLVTQKLVDADPDDFAQHAYIVGKSGQIIGGYNDMTAIFATPLQNADLDGAPAIEDRLTTFGQVVDGSGNRRLTTDWYWELGGLTAEEKRLDVRDQWARSPFAFDLDNDGRDELIVWGRHVLMVGTLRNPPAEP